MLAVVTMLAGATVPSSVLAQNRPPILAATGLAEDAYRNGKEAFDRQDYAAALTWYRKAADHGDAVAQTAIGVMYRDSHGVTRDYAQAMAWFRKAADQGNALAQRCIGHLYQNGLGVPQDDAQAMIWYRKAADQGDADAQTTLGLMYRDSRSVTRDYAQAMTWFRKAADQGNTLAQNCIAHLYQSGLGVPQDDAQAMTWYRKAADQGDADARTRLAELQKAASTTAGPPGRQALSWALGDDKDAMTDKVTRKATSQVKFSDGTTLEASARCNDVGVEFALRTFRGNDASPFAWDGNAVLLRVRVDEGEVRTATAEQEYINEAVISFFDPETTERLRRSGAKAPGADPLLAGLLAGMILNNVESQAAGTVVELTKARNIRVELPLADGSTNVVDLNPRDVSLNELVRACIAALPRASEAERREEAAKRAEAELNARYGITKDDQREAAQYRKLRYPQLAQQIAKAKELSLKYRAITVSATGFMKNLRRLLAAEVGDIGPYEQDFQFLAALISRCAPLAIMATEAANHAFSASRQPEGARGCDVDPYDLTPIVSGAEPRPLYLQAHFMNVVKWGPDNEPWSLDSKYFRRREQTPYRLLVLIAPRDRAVRQLQQIYEAVVVPDNASTTEAQ